MNSGQKMIAAYTTRFAFAAATAVASFIAVSGAANALDGAINITNPATCEIDVVRLAANTVGISNPNAVISGDAQSATLDFDFNANTSGYPTDTDFGDIEAGRFRFALDVVCNAMWNASLTSVNGAFVSAAGVGNAVNGFKNQVDYEVRFQAGSVVNTGFMDATSIAGGGHQMLGLQPHDGGGNVTVRWSAQSKVLAGDDYNDVLTLSFMLQ